MFSMESEALATESVMTCQEFILLLMLFIRGKFSDSWLFPFIIAIIRADIKCGIKIYLARDISPNIPDATALIINEGPQRDEAFIIAPASFAVSAPM